MDVTTRLALAARDGDRDALAVLIDTNYDVVWRYSAAVAGTQDAGDVAQETFERAIKALPRYRAESAVSTWLIGIARHVSLDHARCAARWRRAAPPIPLRPMELAEPEPAAWIELSDLIHRLDPDRRDAFVLTQVMGFRYEEAAQICGCPAGTIRSRIARARCDLMAMTEAGQPAAVISSQRDIPGPTCTHR